MVMMMVIMVMVMGVWCAVCGVMSHGRGADGHCGGEHICTGHTGAGGDVYVCGDGCVCMW